MFSHPNMTINTPIESPSRVDKKYDVSNFFIAISGPKMPKNNIKIRIYKKHTTNNIIKNICVDRNG